MACDVVRSDAQGRPLFPGGTIDAFDVWLELQAVDEKGQTLFWSGKIEDTAKARSRRARISLDHCSSTPTETTSTAKCLGQSRDGLRAPDSSRRGGHRALRLHIPESAGDKITLHAKLNYRKFMWFNTQFAFAGVKDSKSRTRRSDSGL